ncbi:MAG: response regulator [Candidatus Hydrogenedentes bacterium]|nr:response regulator [Candidatus Hydrogenedentota bacterium]
MSELRVLIVSDDPLLRHMTSAWFERSGFSVTAVSDSERAAEACERARFDAVIVDFEMVNMQSYETVLFLRAQAREQAIVVLMDSPEERFSALICGASKALVKPVPMIELEREVRRVIEESAARWASAGVSS